MQSFEYSETVLVRIVVYESGKDQGHETGAEVTRLRHPVKASGCKHRDWCHMGGGVCTWRIRFRHRDSLVVVCMTMTKDSTAAVSSS